MEYCKTIVLHFWKHKKKQKKKKKKTQTHHTQNKTKCIHEHNIMPTKQSTLFGGLAKATTYYKHEAKTRFEKFIEAFYYFNKNGKDQRASV